jgi:hypothetical protein
MITKRVIVIIKNVITLIHYGIKYLAIRALEVLREFRSISKEYHNSFKKSLDYLDKPRYISADYEDNMEYYDNPKSEVKISKWDKKSAPYCETP